jgi:hypothetical protein
MSTTARVPSPTQPTGPSTRLRCPSSARTTAGYNGNFPDPGYQRLVKAALALYNDAIRRTAIAHRLPVIDLRAVCTYPEDYANPIEPSSVGGEKIARAIAALATGAIPSDGITHIIAR